jgi:hypothetical protein
MAGVVNLVNLGFHHSAGAKPARFYRAKFAPVHAVNKRKKGRVATCHSAE